MKRISKLTFIVILFSMTITSCTTNQDNVKELATLRADSAQQAKTISKLNATIADLKRSLNKQKANAIIVPKAYVGKWYFHYQGFYSNIILIINPDGKYEWIDKNDGEVKKGLVKVKKNSVIINGTEELYVCDKDRLCNQSPYDSYTRTKDFN